MKVLSMGWGVQTWTLAAMTALEELPPVDFIVHADTGHEHKGTYEFARQWTPWLGEHGCTVVTVRGKRTDVVREDWGVSGAILIPALTLSAATGKKGQLRRQCTHDWKIMPIRRFIREELKRRKLKQTPGIVESQLGISLDEWRRMKDSDVAYITNTYPLVDLRMKRADCIAWLKNHGLPVPPKSSCTFCPYKALAAWREMKRGGGPDWQEAVAVDQAVRDKRPQHGPLFIHPHRLPLAQAVDIPEDHGATQLSLTDACESGFCHV
jgi:hypothetical protein